MPAPLRVQLSEEDDETWRQLSLSDGPAPIVKQRGIALRLNAAGWNVPAIAQHLGLHEHTVCTAIKRWPLNGVSGLWDAPRSGRPCGKPVTGRRLKLGCKNRAVTPVVSSVKRSSKNVRSL